MRLVKIVGVTLALLLVVLGIGAVALDRYLQSASFKQAVLDAARGALGSDVSIQDLQVSLWSGATLRRISVANAGEVPGDLLTAEALVIRYRLWPLLRRRLEVRRVSLEAPVLRLARTGKGDWNFERLGSRRAGGTGGPEAARPSAPGGPSPPGAVSALEVFLPNLAVSRGRLLVVGDKGKPVTQIEDLDLSSTLRWTGGRLAGEGRTRIETLNVGDSLFLRGLSAPLRLSEGEIALTPFTATLAGGDVRGSLGFRLASSARYVAEVAVRDADVERLLQEARARRSVSGKLQAQATIEGTGGLQTVSGRGHAEIAGGRLLDVPVLSALALSLRVPALANLRFDECRVEFTLANGIMQTPLIRLISRDIQITGHGAVALQRATLDHQMTLALSRSIVDRAPREVRAQFTERADGMRTVEFRMWGPLDAPSTDLSDRMLKGVTEQILRKGLKKLFR